MRILLDGIALNTTRYFENGDIHLTCITDDDASFEALSAAVDAEGRVLDLRRGGERIAVRVTEHAVWPPHLRRLEGTLHRHEIHLEFARVAAPAS